jgi:SAM-dependent methyltransferase
MTEATEFWDDHYRRHSNVWHGRANAYLIDVARRLPPGRALDLGCGEGGDAFWLAEHGWHVTAVDVSSVALARVRAEAARRGLAGSIECQQHDLAASFPRGRFDVVSAQFLQSPLEFDRPQVLRSAAAAVNPGGVLLIVDHASAPPWSWDPDFRSAGPEALVETLQLNPQQWRRLRTEQLARKAIGPHDQIAVVYDDVIELQRVNPLRPPRA